MTLITKIEGIGAAYAEKQAEAGITTVEELLERGASPKGRKALLEATEISAKLILKWVNRADLFRIKGIGEEYGDLLEIAGVATVPELAQRNAANLYQKVIEVNKERKLVRHVPSENQVQSWIEQAKELPRKVTY